MQAREPCLPCVCRTSEQPRLWMILWACNSLPPPPTPFPSHSSCQVSLSHGSTLQLQTTVSHFYHCWDLLTTSMPSCSLPGSALQATDRLPEQSFSEWSNTMSLYSFSPPRILLWPPCRLHTHQTCAILQPGPCCPLSLGCSPLLYGFVRMPPPQSSLLQMPCHSLIYWPASWIFVVVMTWVSVLSICTSRMWAPWGWLSVFPNLVGSGPGKGPGSQIFVKWMDVEISLENTFLWICCCFSALISFGPWRFWLNWAPWPCPGPACS